VIVFAPDFIGRFAKVSAQGGTASRQRCSIKPSTPRIAGPGFCPTANILFFSPPVIPEAIPKQNGIYFGSVDSTETAWSWRQIRRRSTRPAIFSIGQHGAGGAALRSRRKAVLSGSAIPLVTTSARRRGRLAQHFRRLSERTHGLPAPAVPTRQKPSGAVRPHRGKPLADYDPQETTINRCICASVMLGVRDVRLSPDNKRVAYLPAEPAFGRSTWSARPKRGSPSISR
jgi:hypothetical protein